MCASKALIDVLSLAMLRAALALTDWQVAFVSHTGFTVSLFSGSQFRARLCSHGRLQIRQRRSATISEIVFCV